MGIRFEFHIGELATALHRLRSVIKRRSGKLVCLLCDGGEYVGIAGGAQCNRCGSLLAFSHTRDGQIATLDDVLDTFADMDTAELPTITG